MSAASVTQYKLVLLGDSGVGKSSLLHRFVTDTFDMECSPTIGAAFMSKTITLAGRGLKFNIWDTAGQERYRALTKMYYRDATVALLVFDLTNPESFRSLDAWRLEIAEHGPRSILLAVAANKEDVVAGTDAEAQRWAQMHDAIYQRTSAKTSTGVEQLFLEIALALTSDKTASIKQRASAVVLRTPQRKNHGNCCGGAHKVSKANT